MVTRRLLTITALLGTALVAVDAQRSGVGGGRGEADNRFYEHLIARGDKSVCRSWRPPGSGHPTKADCDFDHQLTRIGGAHDGDLDARADQEGLYVSYDYARDTDPEKQDATRLDMPMWVGKDNDSMGALEVALTDSSATNCTQTVDMKSSYTNGLTYVPANTVYSVVGRDYRIGNEIVTACDPPGATGVWDSTAKVMYVNRAQHGSTAVAHGTNELVLMATQSLQTQLRTDISLVEGETGAFYWEWYLTDDWIDTDWVFPGGMKTFQIFNTLFLEPGLDFNNAAVLAHGRRACYTRYTHAFNFRIRPYLQARNSNPTWASARDNQPGPGWGDFSEDLQPVGRSNTEYCGLPSRWHRAFVRLQYTTQDWLVANMWVWDKDRDPVHILNNALMGAGNSSAGTTRKAFTDFWQEWNYSHEEFEWGTVANIDVVLRAYIKNFVYLEAPGAASAGSLSDASIASIFARSDVRPCGVTYAC